jgi:hypothetical protein
MNWTKSENTSEKYKWEPDFQIQKWSIQSGANMAVTGEAWCKVWGMPEIEWWEDLRFRQNIEKLEGAVAKNYIYTVTYLDNFFYYYYWCK